MSKKHQVIINSDAGADDLFALSLALMSPNILIDKIICSYGSFDMEDSYGKIKHFVGGEAEVRRGEKKPLKCSYSPPKVILHSDKKDLFSFPSYFSSIKNKVSDDRDFIYISMGPLTNLAKLITSGRAKKITKIVIMGGAFFHPGNSNLLAEANFFWDPDAVSIVLKSNIPIFIIPLNISDYVPLDINKILNQEYKTFIKKLFKKYNDYYKYEKKFFLSPKNNFKKEAYGAGCLHDPLAIASIINPKIIGFKKIFISDQNIHSPRGFVYPVIRGDHLKDGCYQINMAVNFNSDPFWETINQLLS